MLTSSCIPQRFVITAILLAWSALFSNSAQALDPQLVYTDDFLNQIKIGPLDGSAFSTLASNTQGVVTPQGIAIDDESGELYFFNGIVQMGTISRLNVDGSDPSAATVVPLVSNGSTIAIDTVNDQIYWAHAQIGAPTNNRVIMRMPLSGGPPEILIDSGDPLLGPLGLAVDPAGGKVYWADTFNNGIYKMNLDGSNQELFHFLGDVSEPGAVALDLVSQEVYWTDTLNTRIEHKRIDGTGSVSGFPAGAGMTHLLVNTADRKLIWIERNFQVLGGGAIIRADLDGTNQEVLESEIDPGGIVIAPATPDPSPSPSSSPSPSPTATPDPLPTPDPGIPPLTVTTVIEVPPEVVVDGDSATIVMKEFSGIEIASLLGLNSESDPVALPLLPGDVSIQYHATVSADSGKTLDTYRTSVSKKRVITFNNLEPNQWVATYKVYIAAKRTKTATNKFVDKFTRQLDKAAPGSKKQHILQRVKLKLQAKFGLPFVTNDSPPQPFEITPGS